jgi:hypothetical protein
VTGNTIGESTSTFPFKEVAGKKGIKYQQKRQRPGSKDGALLEIEHNGHDHVSLVFKELYETTGKRQGSRCNLRWAFDAKAAVQFASLLFHIADNHLRDSAEEPYTAFVAKDRAELGSNWIREDYRTAIARTEKRKSRSHLFGLMKRCIEISEDQEFINFLAVNLAMWADDVQDEFAIQQAEKALFQLGLVPRSEIN